MKKHLALLVATSALFLLAYASTEKPWDGTYSTFKAHYMIYSNDLDEKQAPTRDDRRMSFMVEGQVAKEMFESIGPDLKDACGASSRLRIREKGDLECTYDKDMPSSPYTCRFGLNLRTGKSIPGSTC
jgi:hypothetical protein